MITTVCMNPSFDKTSMVRCLIPGEVNRLENTRCDAGGKGLNVSLTLQNLGVKTTCLGCLGVADETAFHTLLQPVSLCFHSFPLAGKTRTNLKLLDAETGLVTELNESGPPMDAKQLQRFISLLQKVAADSTYVVFSGSLPADCSEDAYQLCMHALPDKRCILDASGNPLLLGIQEKPFMVKPNLSELQTVFGKELRTLDGIRDTAYKLIRDGVQNVIVSMAKDGALFVDARHAIYAPALQVTAKSTVGAGDAMLGGILMGLEKGADMLTSFRYGVAAGAASVLSEGTQPLQYADFEMLLPQVTLREI